MSVVATLCCAASLGAQNSPQMSPAAALPQWRTFLGANPLGIPLDIVSLEAETAMSAAATIGAGLSYNDIDHRVYRTADARFKYYPGEIAMRGFSIGLSVGYTKFTGPETFRYDPFGNPTTTPASSLSAGTIGVLVDYNWAQGPSQRFVIGTGIGTKRILAPADQRDKVGLDRPYVTGRFVIGLLF